MSDRTPDLASFDHIARHELDSGATVHLFRSNGTCKSAPDEVLYVDAKECTTLGHDYVSFHQKFVQRRVELAKNSNFSLVYDVRGVPIPHDPLRFIQQSMPFIKMHSDLGDVYLNRLHTVVVVLRSVDAQRTLNTLLALVDERPERPLLMTHAMRDVDKLVVSA